MYFHPKRVIGHTPVHSKATMPEKSTRGSNQQQFPWQNERKNDSTTPLFVATSTHWCIDYSGGKRFGVCIHLNCCHIPENPSATAMCNNNFSGKNKGKHSAIKRQAETTKWQHLPVWHRRHQLFSLSASAVKDLDGGVNRKAAKSP